jgi:hypothetical protein
MYASVKCYTVRAHRVPMLIHTRTAAAAAAAAGGSYALHRRSDQ